MSIDPIARGLAAKALAVAAAGSFSLSSNLQTGATYTFALSDANNLVVTGNSAAAQTFTLPTNATVPFAVGTVLRVSQLGAGAVTIAVSSGVTINVPADMSLTLAQYQMISLWQIAANEWVLFSDLPNMTSAIALWAQSLPTSLPASSGQLWNNDGVISIS